MTSYMKLMVGIVLVGSFALVRGKIIQDDTRILRRQIRATDSSGSPEVNTTSGVAVGITTDYSHAFYGIPYAVPPVGSLRFQDPQPLTSSETRINATVNDHLECPQYNNNCEETGTPCTNENEDCLVLNVFVPRSVDFLGENAQSLRLPVMFYIHGGSFRTGSGTDDTLDGQRLSNTTSSVVVTINYRLGSLGFLVHQQSGEIDIAGNQGLKDQRLAMTWVQDNIAGFGGDKAKVMLFGNSAGAQSVMFHTISSASAPLFAYSIQQSNPNIFSFYVPDMAASLRVTQRLLEVLGCNTTVSTERECLMAASAKELMAAMPAVESATVVAEDHFIYSDETFMPVLDGAEFTDQPEVLYRDGKWSTDKPSIIGVTTEENVLAKFFPPTNSLSSEDAFRSANQMRFGVSFGDIVTDKYIAAYPDQDYATLYGIIQSHYFFDCPSRLMARYASNASSSAVYFYADSHPAIFDYCLLLNNGSATGCRLAYHTSELPYVFRTLSKNVYYTEEDQVIEDEFSTYWGSFARTGSPSNGLDNPLGDFTNWLEYSVESVSGAPGPWSNLHITAPVPEMQSGYIEDLCDFWDGVNYGRNSQSTSTATTNSTQGTTQISESTTSSATSYHFASMVFLVIKVVVVSFFIVLSVHL